MYKQQKQIYDLPIGLFNHFLKPKYTQLIKGIRSTPKHLEYIIVGDIQLQKREIFKAILFNQEEVLIQGFLKIEKVKLEVALLIKIKITYKGKEILLGVYCCINIHSSQILYLQI